MMFMPFQVLGVWFRGLIALAFLGAGAWLLSEWNERRVVIEAPAPGPSGDPDGSDTREVRVWRFGWNRPTAYLVGGLSLIVWGLGGGALLTPLLHRRGAGKPDPSPIVPRSVQVLRQPDGAALHVESFGPEEGPTIILTHGWGANSEIWAYAKRELGDRFNLVAWDLPGLGRSTGPRDKDWSQERLASYLDAVITSAGDRPVTLLGHSIGGMVILTWCRLNPRDLDRKVAGLVLVHTTPTNPVKTAAFGGVLSALQKPLLEPLCHLMIGLAPLVWAMNWLSYLNGSLHRDSAASGFSRRATRGQVDFVARLGARAWPAVMARGMLGMFRYDARRVLPAIGVPALVVAADEDPVCLPGASGEIAAAMPRATVQALSPAKHIGLFEHHERFAALVGHFVLIESNRGASA